ncbi:MAG TPA: hypothetical protein VET65_05445 [Candidatus Limnocylindrales bacterium]|nr:hypothetical protein [Candidatus Limnocylindrales bacterium]
MQVAIYAKGDADGKRFLQTLKRRIDREEIRAWELRRQSPLTLVHSGDRYAKVRVTITPLKTRGSNRAVTRGLGAFADPAPTLVATISEGPSADRVLGFLVGLLTRHATPLGVAGIGIPLES